MIEIILESHTYLNKNPLDALFLFIVSKWIIWFLGGYFKELFRLIKDGAREILAHGTGPVDGRHQREAFMLDAAADPADIIRVDPYAREFAAVERDELVANALKRRLGHRCPQINPRQFRQQPEQLKNGREEVTR